LHLQPRTDPVKTDAPLEGSGFEPSVDSRGGEGAEVDQGGRERRSPFSRGDQRFESLLLQQRVYCEPDFSGRVPWHIAEDAIVMEDGTSHPADIIIHARRPASPSFTEFYPDQG
jgi:hypothetical protein